MPLGEVLFKVVDVPERTRAEVDLAGILVVVDLTLFLVAVVPVAVNER